MKYRYRINELRGCNYSVYVDYRSESSSLWRHHDANVTLTKWGARRWAKRVIRKAIEVHELQSKNPIEVKEFEV